MWLTVEMLAKPLRNHSKKYIYFKLILNFLFISQQMLPFWKLEGHGNLNDDLKTFLDKQKCVPFCHIILPSGASLIPWFLGCCFSPRIICFHKPEYQRTAMVLIKPT